MQAPARIDANPLPPHTECRAETRASLNFAVVVEVHEGTAPAVAHDLDMWGVFIECPWFRAEVQRGHLRLPVLGLPPAIGAEVEWVTRDRTDEPIGGRVRLHTTDADQMLVWARYVRSLC